MVGYKDGTRTILTAIPTVPPSFTNISNLRSPGTYLLGHTHMQAANISITSLWHKTVSKADDILLGILTAFLIAVIYDIISSILLRTRNSSVSAPAIRAAYAIDQFSRLRPIRSASREPGLRFPRLFALAVVVAVFAVDVVFVLLTQQSVTHSTMNQYNIVAFQPVGTTRGRATTIRRVAGDRQCMTPVMRDAKQRRNYAISACIHTTSKEASERYARETDFVAMRSWYHRGGSDHNITFGDGWYYVSVRAYLYTDSDNKGGRHVLFNSSKTMEDAFFVQELAMYGSMEWACNERGEGETALQSCEEVVRSLSVKRRDIVGKDIVLWRGEKGNVVERVQGAVTRFEVSLKEPFQAINSGIRAFFTSSVIYEVEGSGAYVRINNGIKENGIGGLISEDGRVAGVWLMLGLLGLLTGTLVVLRVVLRPTTLGEVAMRSTRPDVEMGDIVDPWEEEERETVRRRRARQEEIEREMVRRRRAREQEIEREMMRDEWSICSSG